MSARTLWSARCYQSPGTLQHTESWSEARHEMRGVFVARTTASTQFALGLLTSTAGIPRERLISMTADAHIHHAAIVETGASIGPGTRVWAFTHVLPGASVGADCNICDHVFIEGSVEVGSRVTIKSGVQLWDGIRLADDVFVGPNATFTNDPFPRSKQHPERYLTTTVGRGASIGANATILPGVAIGAGAMVGAGAVVTRDIPPNAIVHGNPARIVGYVDATQPTDTVSVGGGLPEGEHAGAHLIRLPVIEDLRGRLTFAQTDGLLPFEPARVFLVYGVPSRDVRGEHAHRHCHQLLIATSGTLSVVVDNGTERVEVALTDPSVALHIPPMVWATEYKYSADATLVVFASDHYDPDDYIRDYDDYLDAVGRR